MPKHMPLAEVELPSTIEGLAVSYDAFRAAADVFLSFMNRPRGARIDLLDELFNAMRRQADRAVERLQTLQPTTCCEHVERARILICHSFTSGEQLSDIFANLGKLAVLAGETVKSEETRSPLIDQSTRATAAAACDDLAAPVDALALGVSTDRTRQA
jgi:hypothetical protein